MIKWTQELLTNEALKYKTRGEFAKKNKSAYNSATNQGFLDSICSHMHVLLKYVWTLEEIKIEALKYNNRKSFAAKCRGAYNTAKRIGILEDVCFHMLKRDDPHNLKWSIDNLKLEALKYKTRGSFQKNNGSAYGIARDRGVLDQICIHMISRSEIRGEFHGSSIRSDLELQNIALRFANKLEFMEKESGAYQSAYKRGILDNICTHMLEGITTPWGIEDIQEEALKYNTRTEFQKNSSAYQAASKRKILDNVCKHMSRDNTTSCYEKSLADRITALYPKTQKLRDRKVKIEGKPHIQGFDIDIYIPELRKGVEFDGDYWHSIPGLKRSRDNWPEEDLVNYHKIKDTWFKTKGIDILHINEEDWLKDRQECIDKCMKFLEGK